MRWMIAWVGLAVLLVPSGTARSSGDGRRTLKGLQGVLVAIEDFSGSAKQAGYSVSTFQADVELKLRTAGIKVLSEDEYLTTPGMPLLFVVVAAPFSNEKQRSAPIALQLRFRQDVRLHRDPDVVAAADTWSKNVMGFGDVSLARDSLKDLVDQFINAWLSVNPKQ